MAVTQVCVQKMRKPKGRALGGTRVNKGSARRWRRAVRKRWRKQEM